MENGQNFKVSHLGGSKSFRVTAEYAITQTPDNHETTILFVSKNSKNTLDNTETEWI